MLSAVFLPAGSREFILRLESYQKRSLCGTVYHRRYREGVPFESSTAFVLAVENILDTENCLGANDGVNTSPLKWERGELATFRIEILFRQNSSWQGRIVWMENKKEVTFRSVLELLIILDEALA